ncbi:hypothetical protein KAI04_01915 [Candidatus Pacearchaeota archaeon]|nr:hypothetical protein [Candidatus Pacearchaeota archaeon]
MKISKKKREKISEQILLFLYSVNPKSIFTLHIAQELARDEEFIKKILLELKNKKLVLEIKKNPQGINYKRRLRWRLSEKAYQAYKANQTQEI